MQRERHRAVRAHGLLAALAAEEARGVAPPVQEDEALLAPGEPGGEGVAQGRAEDGVASGLEHGPPVHDLDPREALRADATREEEPLVLAPQRVRVRLHGGRGRAQHHRAGLEARAHHRDVASVVPRALVLLVGPVVLLVDDDQPQVGNRREHRGAGAHDDPRVALPDAPPLIVPLPRRELAVQHRHRPPEARARRAHEHRRQADLGHEDDRPPAPRESRLDGAEVDLRLPAARHAVEEERPERPSGEGVEQRPQRRLLVRGRLHRQELARGQPFGPAHVALLDDAQGSLLGQPIDRPAQGRAVADELGHAGTPAGGAQPLQDLRLRAAPRLERHLGEDGDPPLAEAGRLDVLLHLHEARAAQARDARLRVPTQPLLEGRQPQRAALQLPQHGILRGLAGLDRRDEADERAAGPHAGGRQDGPVALARRREVVLGHPGGEVEERRRDERALVEHLRDLFQRLARDFRRRAGHDPDHPPAAEGNEHAHAALRRRDAARHPVGEGRLEGHRQRDGDEGRVHGDHSTRREGDAGSGRAAKKARARPASWAIRRDPGRAGPEGPGRSSCPPRRPSWPPGSAGGTPDGRSA